MEPASLPVTKGRGSIEDPEVLENVPGHVIPILEREFDDFDTESAKFLRGETRETEFIGFRLKQGVYGQRQAGVQMIRVKLPFGGITPEQMDAFADVVERYVPLNKGHITTRQNIQMHHVPLPDAAKAIRELGDAGLSSREGCGNTIRNVTGDPWAGVSEGAPFDITPYAMAYVRYFVRHPVTQLMPRKVKTAFTATDEDVAMTGIHDIGFIPRMRDGVRGVEIRVGGGTSIMPRIAPTLYEFVDHEEAKAPPPPASYSNPNGDRSEFARFRESNVRRQRQEGFSAVEVKVTRGDLTPEQLRGLAAIMREFTGGYARASAQQNFVLRWVRDQSVYDVWQRLRELDLGDAGAHQITDVVSCPGTDSCKLGITSSMGLNTAVQERLEQMQITDPLTKQIHVKMSGCPNGCSQHHIANIGFYGAAMKVGGRQLPAYIPHLGGNYEGGDVVMGKRLKSRIPAKRVPDAVERWVRHYEQNRTDGEAFNAFVERVGADQFEALVKDLSMPVEFGPEHIAHFIDWERKELYEVVRGEGECAV